MIQLELETRMPEERLPMIPKILFVIRSPS
jgi:hypothetical protein